MTEGMAQIEKKLPSYTEITLEQYAARWLAGLPARPRPKTVHSYGELYRLHIGPAAGAIKCQELRRAQVKQLLIEKKAQGLRRNTSAKRICRSIGRHKRNSGPRSSYVS